MTGEEERGGQCPQLNTIKEQISNPVQTVTRAGGQKRTVTVPPKSISLKMTVYAFKNSTFSVFSFKSFSSINKIFKNVITQISPETIDQYVAQSY